MYRVRCPHCGKVCEIEPSSDYATEEGEIYDFDCLKCENVFCFEIHIDVNFDVYKNREQAENYS